MLGEYIEAYLECEVKIYPDLGCIIGVISYLSTHNEIIYLGQFRYPFQIWAQKG